MNESPDLLDGAEHGLDSRISIAWAIGGSILPLLLTAGGVVAVAATGADAALIPVIVAVGVVLLVGVAVWSRMAWARWRWRAWPDAIELRHGVVTVRESLVPYHRIQQIDVDRDPIERVLGLSKLILRTASAASDAKIPGLPEATAEALRRRLLALADVDDAV